MNQFIHPDIERVLFTEDEIRARVAQLAEEIRADYEGKELTLIAVLRGAVFFVADLARALQLPVRCPIKLRSTPPCEE